MRRALHEKHGMNLSGFSSSTSLKITCKITAENPLFPNSNNVIEVGIPFCFHNQC